MADFDEHDRDQRQQGIAQLFYDAQASQTDADKEPGRSLYWLIGELVDPADVKFFDWSPDATDSDLALLADPEALVGELVIVTSTAIVHIAYSDVQPYTDEGTVGNMGKAVFVTRRLADVRELRWSFPDINSVRAGVNGTGIVVAGDGWEITLATEKHKQSGRQFERFAQLQIALGFSPG